jgi:hypothetical protein
MKSFFFVVLFGFVFSVHNVACLSKTNAVIGLVGSGISTVSDVIESVRVYREINQLEGDAATLSLNPAMGADVLAGAVPAHNATVRGILRGLDRLRKNAFRFAIHGVLTVFSIASEVVNVAVLYSEEKHEDVLLVVSLFLLALDVADFSSLLWR